MTLFWALLAEIHHFELFGVTWLQFLPTSLSPSRLIVVNFQLGGSFTHTKVSVRRFQHRESDHSLWSSIHLNFFAVLWSFFSPHVLRVARLDFTIKINCFQLHTRWLFDTHWGLCRALSTSWIRSLNLKFYALEFLFFRPPRVSCNSLSTYVTPVWNIRFTEFDF